MTTPVRVILLAALAALAAPAAGCLSSNYAPAGEGSGGSGGGRGTTIVHAVQRGDENVFEPATVTVKAGEKVTWDVVGEGHHTVDFLDAIDQGGTTPESGDLGPGQTFEVGFLHAGTYKYYCKYHSNKETGMLGFVVVVQ